MVSVFVPSILCNSYLKISMHHICKICGTRTTKKALEHVQGYFIHSLNKQKRHFRLSSPPPASLDHISFGAFGSTT
jgi:uncharacterized protein YbgA (DUF1722 family)